MKDAVHLILFVSLTCTACSASRAEATSSDNSAPAAQRAEQPQEAPARETMSAKKLAEARSGFEKAWNAHMLVERFLPFAKDGSQSGVDYKGWAASADDRAAIATYLKAAAAAETQRMSNAEQLAFYITTYDAAALSAILNEQGGVERPEAPDPSQSVVVGRKKTTLGRLSDQIGRDAPFADPRAYFGMICGARGCLRTATGLPHPKSIDEWLARGEEDIVLQTTQMDTKSKTVRTIPFFKTHRAAFEKAYGSLAGYFAHTLEENRKHIRQEAQRNGNVASFDASLWDAQIKMLQSADVTFEFRESSLLNRPLMLNSTPHRAPRKRKPHADECLLSVYSQPPGTVLVGGESTGKRTPATISLVVGKSNEVAVQFDDGAVSDTKEVKGVGGRRFKVFIREPQ